ncbi:MAG: peptidylprolyl isomerase [Phycisphaerales bacterium]
MLFSRTSRSRTRAASDKFDHQSMFEQLEKRELLTVDTVNELTNISTSSMGSNYSVSLLGRYTDSFASGLQIVRIATTAGNIDIALRSDWAPNLVTNFLQYVNEGFYANSIFQFSQRPTADANFGLIEAGGYRPPTTEYSGSVNATNQPQMIPTGERHTAVALEHPTGNTAWTVALYHTASATTGTSEFLIHTLDNSALFDAGDGFAGYGTFGIVLPLTRSTVTTINNYTYYNAASAFPLPPDEHGIVRPNPDLANLPLVRPVPLSLPITPSDYISITGAELLADNTGVETVGWAASITSGANIGTVSVVNGNLVITPTAAHNRGTMTINMHVTSIDGTSSTDDSFTFTIDNYAPLIGGIQGQANVAVGQSMLVSAYGVSDPDALTGGGIAASGVEFWYDANDDGELNVDDDILVGSDTSAAGGWNTRIDTSAMQAGANRVFARVTDTDGEVATTSRVFTLLRRRPVRRRHSRNRHRRSRPERQPGLRSGPAQRLGHPQCLAVHRHQRRRPVQLCDRPPDWPRQLHQRRLGLHRGRHQPVAGHQHHLRPRHRQLWQSRRHHQQRDHRRGLSRGINQSKD